MRYPNKSLQTNSRFPSPAEETALGVEPSWAEMHQMWQINMFPSTVNNAQQANELERSGLMVFAKSFCNFF